MVGTRPYELRPRHRALVSPEHGLASTHRRRRARRRSPGRGGGRARRFIGTDLAIRLDERQRAEKLDAIDRRGRAAFLEGAEAQSQAVEGRPLTVDELERVTKRYPG